MQWTDDGIVLTVSKHGEGHVVLGLLTREHGRHLGYVRGGGSSRSAPALQPGNLLEARWHSRLSENLGSFQVDLITPFGARILDDAPALRALSSVCALSAKALPEREPAYGVFEGLQVLLGVLDQPDIWPAVLVRWELGLLEHLGFGLDLSKCAVTGSRDDLTHVSPRTGRAVCREAAEPYLDKLLPLPLFLLTAQGGQPDARAVHHGLRLTGHFLQKCVFGLQNNPLPDARARLQDKFAPEPHQPTGETDG